MSSLDPRNPVSRIEATVPHVPVPSERPALFQEQAKALKKALEIEQQEDTYQEPENNIDSGTAAPTEEEPTAPVPTAEVPEKEEETDKEDDKK